MLILIDDSTMVRYMIWDQGNGREHVGGVVVGTTVFLSPLWWQCIPMNRVADGAMVRLFLDSFGFKHLRAEL